MTIITKEKTEFTQQEYEELDALRKAITENPVSVHPKQQERFTELFVKSLSYVGYADK